MKINLVLSPIKKQNVMKKILLGLALLGSIAVNADYLYWMVDTESASEYSEFTAIRLTDGQKVIDSYSGLTSESLAAFQSSGGYFEATGNFDISQSFFVELYNGESWLAKSSSVSYSTLLSTGAIFKGGLQPASGPAYSFGSFAVPEPTSGLLFLLGGMLLGLKRRRQV